MAKKDIAILDIGSSSITTLVGERGVNNTFKIKGKGTAEYAGFSDGSFIEPDQLKFAIGLSISNAETSSGVRITELFIGVPGEFSNVVTKDVCISFNKKKKINNTDIDQLFYVGNEYRKHPTFSVINQAAIYFSLDNTSRLIDPVGLHSTKLKGLVSYILAENNFIDFLTDTINEIGIRKVYFVSSCLAETLYLFDPVVRDRYVLLVDCGYISTSVMLGRGDGLLFMNSFSLGGGYITADISQCLKLSFVAAENLKRKLDLSWNAKDNDTYDLHVGDYVQSIDAPMANSITEERIKMIGDYIQKCLDRCDFDFPEYIPIHLTGGGLNFMKGAKEVLSKRLGRKVEIIAPTLPHTNRPDYSSEIGVLDLALHLINNDNSIMVR